MGKSDSVLLTLTALHREERKSTEDKERRTTKGKEGGGKGGRGNGGCFT